MLIFKILRTPEWQTLHEAGEFDGAPIDIKDGYVHASTAEQVEDTAAKHFSGEEGLMLLALDANALHADLKWEVSRGGQDFPHLYRQLRLSDVVWARPYVLGTGGHILPEGVK